MRGWKGAMRKEKSTFAPLINFRSLKLEAQSLMNLCKLLIGSWREERGRLFMRKEKGGDSDLRREAHLTRGHFGRREGELFMRKEATPSE